METFVHVQFKSDTVFGAEAIFPSGILQRVQCSCSYSWSSLISTSMQVISIKIIQILEVQYVCDV